MARVWAESEAMGLTAPERALVEACRKGELCELGTERPEWPDPARTIRAEVLRYLILGGCQDCRVHELGVQLVGAWINGRLDLSFCAATGFTTIVNCRFKNSIEALQTRFELINLTGSAVPALNAQGAQVTGAVFLRNGFRAEGEVSLSGARISGQLVCIGGKFQNPDGRALDLQGAQVAESVFLRDGFKSEGEVSLSSARIGGQLACDGGTFHNAEGDALNAQRMRVEEGLIWCNVTVSAGATDLAGAHVSDLADDLDSWPETGRNYLNGFTYGMIASKFTAVNSRLEWLSRGTVWKGEFHPQPYTHLAKVYRSMGHQEAARRVLLVRRAKVDHHDWQRAHSALNGDWKPAFASVVADFRRALGWLSRGVVGYGLFPFRSLWWLVGLWLIATTLAHFAWHEGSLTPNSDVILTSPGWQALQARTNAAEVWAASPQGRDWETFTPYAWAADLVIPILDLGQTAAWAPSTERGDWGRTLWWARWLLMAAGWIVAALFAAAVTGILRKGDD